MSNALSTAPVPPEGGTLVTDISGVPAADLTAAAESFGRFQTVLIAIGTCLLVVWAIRRLTSPSKLTLDKTPGRPESLTPVGMLVVLAAWAGASAGLSGILKVLCDENSTVLKLLAMIGHQTLWLTVSMVAAALTFRAKTVRALGLSSRRWLWDLTRGIVGYLIIFPLCAGLLYLTARLLPNTMKPESWLLGMIKTSWPGWQSLLGIFSAIILAPLSEEIFFRGLLQSMLQFHTRKPWLAILLTAAAFAAVHIPQWHWLPSLFAFGMALGYGYARSGRLLAPIVMHAIFNSVTIISVITGW